MRVTSIMESYIAEEVAKRIAPKYEEKKQLLETRLALKEKFFDELQDGLNKALNDTINMFLQENPLFVDERDNRWDSKIHVPYSLIDLPKDDVTNWRKDMKNEIETKVKEIVVTLELGGTKKDLDELLKNI